MIKKIIREITAVGYNDAFPEGDNKIVVITNTINFVLFLIVLCWITLALIYYPALKYNLIVLLFMAAGCLFTYYLMFRSKYLFAKTFLLLMYTAAMIVHLMLLGIEFSQHLLFLPTITIAVFIYKKEEKYFKYTLCLICILSFFYFELFYSPKDAVVALSDEVRVILKRSVTITIFGTLTLLSFYIAINSIKAEDNLDTERKRSENLLLNILPKSIANRLKSDTSIIADSFSNVTILFADLVGFTDFASTMPPQNLVSSLNDLFSRFDDLAQKYNLEKIKTIGDCYMVASGLPEENNEHAQLITNFALDTMMVMNTVNEGRSTPLVLRIGINSGPVVAGVIGKKKFIYDLWGDTVNTASRMESHGIPGQIHITRSTFELIKGQFDIVERGEINVKGKGLMTTYFVQSRSQT